MRFRIRTDVWVEVGSLKEAEDALGAVSRACLEPLGQALAEDATTGATATGELVPLDEAAHEALRGAGLGPGISSSTRHRPPG